MNRCVYDCQRARCRNLPLSRPHEGLHGNRVPVTHQVCRGMVRGRYRRHAPTRAQKHYSLPSQVRLHSGSEHQLGSPPEQPPKSQGQIGSRPVGPIKLLIRSTSNQPDHQLMRWIPESIPSPNICPPLFQNPSGLRGPFHPLTISTHLSELDRKGKPPPARCARECRLSHQR